LSVTLCCSLPKFVRISLIDIADFYKLYGEEKINNAILFAKDLKDRYTVLWMNYDFYNEDEI